MKAVLTWLGSNKALLGLVLGGLAFAAQKAGVPIPGVTVDPSSLTDAVAVYLLAKHDHLAS